MKMRDHHGGAARSLGVLGVFGCSIMDPGDRQELRGTPPPGGG